MTTKIEVYDKGTKPVEFAQICKNVGSIERDGEYVKLFPKDPQKADEIIADLDRIGYQYWHE